MEKTEIPQAINKEHLLRELGGLLNECERKWGLTPEKVFAFADALAALRKIRDDGLYLETHATFTDYCREQLGWEEPQFAKIVKILEMEIPPQPIQ